MRQQIPELAKNLFQQHNEYLTELSKKGWRSSASDMKKLESSPTLKVLRTAMKVISQEAMNSLMYASPVDAPRIAQLQAYAGFLETFDYILSQSTDCDYLEACADFANYRAESSKKAESHKPDEFTSFK